MKTSQGVKTMSTTIVPAGYEKHVSAAVAHYWKTLGTQGQKQSGGGKDRGARSAVTGGKQMDKFCDLVKWVLTHNGMANSSIYLRSSLELPGYFRPTKKWDMLVVRDHHLIAAIEFKSHAGPSFSNNFNNRIEEALGSAKDLWTAYREDAFGKKVSRPWLGWVMFLEDCDCSTRSISVKEPHFKVFPEFKNTSYAKRYELLLRKLIQERLYDKGALLLSNRTDGPGGTFREPASDLGMKQLLASLGGHVRAYLECR